MATTLRVLGALLTYPDARLRGHLPEMRRLLRDEGALGPARLGEVDALAAALLGADPLDAEAAYVELFDRGRATSLHLFEHVHGDSRDRGPAMVDLARTYASAGLLLAEGELPDYLPAVVEFASTLPPREARAFLGETAHLLAAIFGALQERDSAYAAVLGALLELAGEAVQPRRPPAEEPLDESWAEPPAFDGCSVAGQSGPANRPGDPKPIRIVRGQRPAGPAANPPSGGPA
jgi:nitrate reductase delta subunit